MNQNRVEDLILKVSFSVAFTFLLLLSVEVGSFLVLRAGDWQPSTRLMWMPAGPLIYVPMPYRAPAIRMYDTSSVYNGQPWAAKFWEEAHALNLEYESYIAWRTVPQSGAFISFDRDGLRRTHYSKCDDARAYTIWTFGGSTMWGDGSPDWLTIPSFLAADYQKSGRPVCVRNYGERGYVSTQEVIRLFLELKRSSRPPNLVIFYDGINDVFSLYQGGRIDVHENFDNVKQKLTEALAWWGGQEGFRYLRGSNTYLLLERLRRRFSGASASRFSRAKIPEADVPRQFQVAYLKNIDTVALLARQYGFSYAFFWQPVMYAEHKPLTREEQSIRQYIGRLFPGEDVLFRRMYTLARAETRPHLFYIADIFNNVKTTLYIDDWHVGPEGDRLIAERIYETLARQEEAP